MVESLKLVNLTCTPKSLNYKIKKALNGVTSDAIKEVLRAYSIDSLDKLLKSHKNQLMKMKTILGILSSETVNKGMLEVR